VGKKRGTIVLDVVPFLYGHGLFYVNYKSSKCKHAKVKTMTIHAIDELDAYRKAKEEHVLP
jgi:hypothetical protein